MADAVHIPDEAETRARWDGFAWSDANTDQVKVVMARYPKGQAFGDHAVARSCATAGWLGPGWREVGKRHRYTFLLFSVGSRKGDPCLKP